ncbi:MAG TPA: DNA polymerase IV, partial [Clostridiales bacterium]|nr:DNA polymerase IV [Clostridiales bacterium]
MGERIIFHIDANSAFLSWSAVNALQHGATVDYREIPSIVGGNQATRHGIVLAKSIPAKKYGIQTGEPVIQA